LISVFVISIPLVWTGIGGHLFNALLIKMAFLINSSVEKVASLPGAVLDELNLDGVSLCLWLGLLGAGMVLLNHKIAWARYILICLLSAILCWNARCRFVRIHSSELVVGHFSQASMLTFRAGSQVDHYCLLKDSSAIQTLEQYTTQNWSNHNFRSTVMELGSHDSTRGRISDCVRMAPGVWLLGNDRIQGWIISGDRDHMSSNFIVGYEKLINGFTFDFLLLTGNPPLRKIPQELIGNSDQVILDGTNQNWYLSVIERLKEDSGYGFTPYHTVELGAYLKRW